MIKKFDESYKNYTTNLIVNEINHEKNLKELDNLRKFREGYDPKAYNDGMKWFEDGNKLEDSGRTDSLSFTNGYGVAQRRAKAQEMQYENGKNYYKMGMSLEEIAKSKIKINDFLKKGYIDAMIEDDVKNNNRPR